MANSPPLLPLLLLTVTFSILLSPLVSSTLQPPKTSFKIRLTHVDAGQNFTKLELIQRAITRGKHKLEKLTTMSKSAASNDIHAPIQSGYGEYLLNLSIGTPPLPFLAIMDTGSDLIWTQCKPCTNCFEQPTPIFDPMQSSSFADVPCSSDLCKDMSSSRCNDGCEYLYTYGDDSSTQGFLATDTFTFCDESMQQVSVPNIGFGCGVDNQGKGLDQGAGLLGLGLGQLSLVTQLGAKKFSYCLPSLGDNKTSSLLFGSLADLNFTGGAIEGTPLIQNPVRPSFYYLSLQGITVGKTLLRIQKSLFELGEDGRGGMIIDSGTTLTLLHEDAYDVLKQAFVSQTKLRVSESDAVGLDLCFDLPSGNVTDLKVPKLIFHFEGLDLELPADNYMIADTGLGLVCLAMGATGTLSIFGNIQQQNMLVLHDLEKETVSFVPTQCDQLL